MRNKDTNNFLLHFGPYLSFLFRPRDFTSRAAYLSHTALSLLSLCCFGHHDHHRCCCRHCGPAPLPLAKELPTRTTLVDHGLRGLDAGAAPLSYHAFVVVVVDRSPSYSNGRAAYTLISGVVSNVHVHLSFQKWLATLRSLACIKATQKWWISWNT